MAELLTKGMSRDIHKSRALSRELFYLQYTIFYLLIKIHNAIIISVVDTVKSHSAEYETTYSSLLVLCFLS